ncbi:MAG: DNRLRE domain-containing protein [Xanthomonadales bacterium]|nr:DNRLRE domain-containing protein [Xanthomonadales bacterium]MBP6078766.1 DNRLRE domain-containing protein [Xanthomonadales bacterium]
MKTLMLAFAVIVASGAARADTLMLEPVADATLFQISAGDPETADSQGPHLFVGRIAQGLRRRALLRFDLGALPAGAIIDSARLELSVSRTISGSVNVNLHRMTSAWTEGSADAGTPGGQGTTPGTNDPTWSSSAAPATPWTTLGGDFAATVSGALTLDAEGRYLIPASAGMLDDLGLWINDDGTNFGWALVSDEAQSPPTAKRLESAEAGNASTRPLLVIDYRLPPRVPVPALGAVATLLLVLGIGAATRWTAGRR